MKLFIFYLSTDCGTTRSYKDTLFQKLACVLRKQFSAVPSSILRLQVDWLTIYSGFLAAGVCLSPLLSGSRRPKACKHPLATQGGSSRLGAPRGSSQGPSSTTLKSFSSSASRRWLAAPLKGVCHSCKSSLKNSNKY